MFSTVTLVPLDSPSAGNANLIFESERRVMSDYRMMAERCVRLAIEAEHDGDRSALLDLAGEWLELAEPDIKTAGVMSEIEALKRTVN